MHDGSIATLREVIEDHYARGGRLLDSGPDAGDGANSPRKAAFVSGFAISRAGSERLTGLPGVVDRREISDGPGTFQSVVARLAGCRNAQVSLGVALAWAVALLALASLAGCGRAAPRPNAAATEDALVMFAQSRCVTPSRRSASNSSASTRRCG